MSYTLTTDTEGKPHYSFHAGARFADIDSKVARVAFLRQMLASDERWAIRGLKAIYRHQTADEQNMGATVEHNGVGFSGVHASIMSDFMKALEKYGSLRPKQMAVVYKIMPKYAKQLERIATGG